MIEAALGQATSIDEFNVPPKAQSLLSVLGTTLNTWVL